MGRITDRLPVHSSTGSFPSLDLTDEDFKELEKELNGTPISDEGRRELLRVCRSYLHWREVELSAAEKKEAEKIWDEMRGRLLNVIEIGEGAYPPWTDAGRFIEGFVFDALEDLPLPLSERDLEPSGVDASLSGNGRLTSHQLTITRDFMMRMAAVLRRAITRVDLDLAEAGPGFRPGGAFADWLSDMRKWATMFGYQYGAAAKGGASNFAAFLYALNNKMPSDLRTGVATVWAMNERLSNHVAGANSPAK